MMKEIKLEMGTFTLPEKPDKIDGDMDIYYARAENDVKNPEKYTVVVGVKNGTVQEKVEKSSSELCMDFINEMRQKKSAR